MENEILHLTQCVRKIQNEYGQEKLESGTNITYVKSSHRETLEYES